jgi:purine-binding chemotaxis protein CheW
MSEAQTEEKKKILKARAEVLSKEPEAKEGIGESLEVVEFLLAQERYGIESSYVREVYPLKDLTPLPRTPPFVLGIINIRGRILSVIDIKKLFDLPERGLTDLNKVIIVRHGMMEMGILADAVIGVASILLSDIQPSLPTLTGVRQRYSKGVTKGPMVILDGAKLLTDPDLVVNEE